MIPLSKSIHVPCYNYCFPSIVFSLVSQAALLICPVFPSKTIRPLPDFPIKPVPSLEKAKL
jgi:hypothetical protein